MQALIAGGGKDMRMLMSCVWCVVLRCRKWLVVKRSRSIIAGNSIYAVKDRVCWLVPLRNGSVGVRLHVDQRLVSLRHLRCCLSHVGISLTYTQGLSSTSLLYVSRLGQRNVFTYQWIIKCHGVARIHTYIAIIAPELSIFSGQKTCTTCSLSALCR